MQRKIIRDDKKLQGSKSHPFVSGSDYSRQRSREPFQNQWTIRRSKVPMIDDGAHLHVIIVVLYGT